MLTNCRIAGYRLIAFDDQLISDLVWLNLTPQKFLQSYYTSQSLSVYDGLARKLCDRLDSRSLYHFNIS